MFYEVVEEISSLFFLRKEQYEGMWAHRSGPVDTKSLVATHGPLTLLKMPQSLYDLGKCYHKPEDRRYFCLEAFYIVLHAFQNDITVDLGPILRKKQIFYIGRGGAVGDLSKISRQLDETYKHITAFKDHAWGAQTPDPMWSDSQDISTETRCAAFISAGSLLRNTKSSPKLNAQFEDPATKYWVRTCKLADDLLRAEKGRKRRNATTHSHEVSINDFAEDHRQRRPNQLRVANTSNLDTSTWSMRNEIHYNTARESQLVPKDMFPELSVHRFTALAQVLSSKLLTLDVLKELHSQTSTMKNGRDVDWKSAATITAFEIWRQSDLCQVFLKSSDAWMDDKTIEELKKPL
jgi:hypothetical protein